MSSKADKPGQDRIGCADLVKGQLLVKGLNSIFDFAIGAFDFDYLQLVFQQALSETHLRVCAWLQAF